MSLNELNHEFKDYLEKIMYSTVNLHDPYERVTIMQWIRMLQKVDDKTVSKAVIRNQYANFLCITMNNDVVHLCAPFKEPPPNANDLRPLCEVLANNLASKCPSIPKTGPIEPVMCQKSSDGRVFTKIKHSPDGSLFCYIAVTPDGFEVTD